MCCDWETEIDWTSSWSLPFILFGNAILWYKYVSSFLYYKVHPKHELLNPKYCTFAGFLTCNVGSENGYLYFTERNGMERYGTRGISRIENSNVCQGK